MYNPEARGGADVDEALKIALAYAAPREHVTLEGVTGQRLSQAAIERTARPTPPEQPTLTPEQIAASVAYIQGVGAWLEHHREDFVRAA